jgi:predicted GH43/DUF377 family glycosyl hydrolase
MFYRAVSRGNHSSIGYCKLEGPLVVINRDTESLLSPEFDYESQGMEDPRIVKIEDIYYLTYTAYDGVNALGCLAISKDLIHFEKKGIIVPQITFAEFDKLAEISSPINKKYFRYNEHIGALESDLEKSLIWDKNVIFFPRKIKGNFYFMHRIKPDIQIVVGVQDLKDLTEAFYQDYLSNFNDHVLLSSKHDHEISYVGGGCPPIETDQGWLIIYHGVKDGLYGYIYSACAALLDLEDPRKEIARLPYPLFKPELDWELKGEVNNVCFPTGAVVFDDTLYIYYGAADERIACASVSVSELITELLLYNKQDDK